MTTPEDHRGGVPTRHVRIAAAVGGVVLVVGIAIAVGTAHGSRHAPATSATSARSASAAASSSAPVAAPPPVSSVSPSSPSSSPSAPVVRWHGTLTVNGPDADRDLDAIPPRTNGQDRDVTGSTFETTLKAESGAQLYVMTGTPGYPECRDAVAANGTDLTTDLHKGDVVCVLTSQGRVARLRVRTAALGFPAATLTADVTVWDPPLPR